MEKHEETLLLATLLVLAVLILINGPELSPGPVSADDTFLGFLQTTVSTTVSNGGVTAAAIGVSGEKASSGTVLILFFFVVLVISALFLEFFLRKELAPGHFPVRAPVHSTSVQTAQRRQRSHPAENTFSLEEEWRWIHRELQELKKKPNSTLVVPRSEISRINQSRRFSRERSQFFR